MPSRWLVPLPGLDPLRVQPHFIHGAFTSWFDRNGPEHASGAKPYSVSLLTQDRLGRPAVELALLTDDAQLRFADAARPGRTVRLGNQVRAIAKPQLVQHESWADLACHSSAESWELTFATPVTFRAGNRSSPLPDPRTMLVGLMQSWRAWSPIEMAPMTVPPWVSDIALASQICRLRVAGGPGRQRDITVSASTGTIVLRSDSVADESDSYLRLAAYTGIGSFTRRGLGVTRVRCLVGEPAV